MNIWTTPEREQLRKTVRSFAEREILPHIDEWERSGDLPRELHRRAGAAGLLGAGFPEAVGGGGGDGADSVIICEEMHQAGAPGGVFASLFTCGIAVPHMIASGDARLIDTFVRPTLAGEKIGALAITEPGGGSDVGHLRTGRGIGRRPLRDQRRQDLHHVRGSRRLRRHRGAHRRAWRRRGFAAGGREGHTRLRGQPQAGQDGLAVLRHRRAVLHRRAGAEGQSRRRREQRIRPDRPGIRLRADRTCRAGVFERAAMSGHHRAVVPRPGDIRPPADLAAVGTEHARRDGPPHRRRPCLFAQRGGAPARRGNQPDRAGVFRQEHRRRGRGMGCQPSRPAVRRYGLHGRIRSRAPIPGHANPGHRWRNHRNPDRTGRQTPGISNRDRAAVHARPERRRLHRGGIGGDDQARRDRRGTRPSAGGRRSQVRRPSPRTRQADGPGTHRAARRPGLAVPRAEPARGLGQRVQGRRQHGRRHRRGVWRGMHDRRQRPDGQRRHQQPVDIAKDTAGQPDRLPEPASRHFAGGIGRGGPAHPEGNLHPRRTDVPRPDPALGGRDPHHRTGIRQLHCGWRLRSRDVRSRGDDQGTLEGVPGRARRW